MGNEIELISDGDGLAVIGNRSAVEQFMSSVGLSSESGPSRLGTAFKLAASATQKASDIAESSGRWVKLTEDSAQAVKDFGLMKTDSPGVSHAMIGQPGNIEQWIQIVKPTSIASNPAVLAGGAGLMAQLAMKQSMAEITDYLATIDEKLDDVLRAQTNQVLAKMDGVELAIKDAMSVRDSVGRVSEVTWSKVQNSAQTINETQGYALRQLRDLTEKIEKKKKIGDLADTVKEAEGDVQKWLVVMARCFELHDAVGVLELERVLDADPDELDRHRVGLRAARQDRLELFSERTELLLLRMSEAVSTANSKVLLNPTKSPAVVRSSNHVVAEVHEFREMIGIESGGGSSEARPWKDAATERWGIVRDAGSANVDTARNLGSESLGQARSAKDKVSGKLAERKLRNRETDDEPDEEG